MHDGVTAETLEVKYGLGGYFWALIQVTPSPRLELFCSFAEICCHHGLAVDSALHQARRAAHALTSFPCPSLPGATCPPLRRRRPAGLVSGDVTQSADLSGWSRPPADCHCSGGMTFSRRPPPLGRGAAGSAVLGGVVSVTSPFDGWRPETIRIRCGVRRSSPRRWCATRRWERQTGCFFFVSLCGPQTSGHRVRSRVELGGALCSFRPSFPVSSNGTPQRAGAVNTQYVHERHRQLRVNFSRPMALNVNTA